MTTLAPLETLLERSPFARLPLPSELADIYGDFRLPPPGQEPYVVANFVQTIDGVVAFESTGHAGGGPISGFNLHDRFVMGLLRATADAVIVGAGTLRSVPKHIWTPEYVAPDYAGALAELRAALKKEPHPLNILVSASGRVSPEFAVFQQTRAPVAVVTTADGAARLARGGFPAHVQIVAASDSEELTPAEILGAARAVRPISTALLEGGPTLMGAFLDAAQVDELFLTLSPQIAGRAEGVERPGLLEGLLFGPERPLWAELMSVRAAGDHLFLRYGLQKA